MENSAVKATEWAERVNCTDKSVQTQTKAKTANQDDDHDARPERQTTKEHGPQKKEVD